EQKHIETSLKARIKQIVILFSFVNEDQKPSYDTKGCCQWLLSDDKAGTVLWLNHYPPYMAHVHTSGGGKASRKQSSLAKVVIILKLVIAGQGCII
nr:autophagy-related protein 2 [Tanacetum cinerariifolium]